MNVRLPTVLTRTHRHPTVSIRTRLTWTFIAVAVVTALVVGSVGYFVVHAYFEREDRQSLRIAAERAAEDLRPTRMDRPSTERVLQIVAVTTQTRIQILDSVGSVVADSGDPNELDASLARDLGIPPSLRNITPTQRTDQRVELPLPEGNQQGWTSIVALEGPRSGDDVTDGLLLGWLVGSVVAVGVAAAVGTVLSHRVARPIQRLERVTVEMAAGNLEVRADEKGDAEIASLAQSYNTMADQLTELFTELQRFLSDAAHQIGTPLTALSIDLEMLEETLQDSGEHTRVQRALGQVRRLEDLTRQLLALSRLQVASEPPRRVDIARIVHEIGEELEGAATAKAIDIVIESPESLWVYLPPQGVHDAISNVVANAIKYSPDGQPVTIAVGMDNSEQEHVTGATKTAKVSILDHGPGVPEDQLALLGQRFFRAASTADKPGTGLGLAISHALCLQWGGTIHYDNVPNGFTVTIHVPVNEGAHPGNQK